MPKQKKLIVLPARFVLCEQCGLHGRIQLADGSQGARVETQAEALASLDQLKEKMLQIEMALIVQQIIDSELPLIGFDITIVRMDGYGSDDKEEEGCPKPTIH
ncbi:MAG: hypothetical protein AAB343_02570 [Patescibacteria group bacterium]